MYIYIYIHITSPPFCQTSLYVVLGSKPNHSLAISDIFAFYISIVLIPYSIPQNISKQSHLCSQNFSVQYQQFSVDFY